MGHSFYVRSRTVFRAHIKVEKRVLSIVGAALLENHFRPHRTKARSTYRGIAAWALSVLKGVLHFQDPKFKTEEQVFGPSASVEDMY